VGMRGRVLEKKIKERKIPNKGLAVVTGGGTHLISGINRKSLRGTKGGNGKQTSCRPIKCGRRRTSKPKKDRIEREILPLFWGGTRVKRKGRLLNVSKKEGKFKSPVDQKRKF